MQSIIQPLVGNLNQNQQNKLSQSINKAKEALSLVNNPLDSLVQNNVNNEFLDKLKGYINNPLIGKAVNGVLKQLNLDKNTALKKIDEIKSYINTNKSSSINQNPNPFINSPQTNNIDDLDKFKRALTHLK